MSSRQGHTSALGFCTLFTTLVLVSTVSRHILVVSISSKHKYNHHIYLVTQNIKVYIN
jgi:hypothetical protein